MPTPIRILNCSSSLENDYLCIEERVAGFTRRGAQFGDQVYLAVKRGKKLYCDARFTLDEVADHKPWADAENYVHALSTKGVEFCQPFEVTELIHFHPYWYLKFVQGSKHIDPAAAVKHLDDAFQKGKTAELYRFLEEAQEPSDTAAEFSAYPVKLVQKIDLLEEESEFALTVE